ncbi:MAG: hypothetical protein EOP91_13085 [Lysobacteraceae bacterium]|nr:MAG: hypothetical protein EOP91_13085 [Xanthomonadaceae bacterium]
MSLPNSPTPGPDRADGCATPDPAPALPGEPGEQPGKRLNQERNDPEVQPGAREGKPPLDGRR